MKNSDVYLRPKTNMMNQCQRNVLHNETNMSEMMTRKHFHSNLEDISTIRFMQKDERKFTFRHHRRFGTYRSIVRRTIHRYSLSRECLCSCCSLFFTQWEEWKKEIENREIKIRILNIINHWTFENGQVLPHGCFFVNGSLSHGHSGYVNGKFLCWLFLE